MHSGLMSSWKRQASQLGPFMVFQFLSKVGNVKEPILIADMIFVKGIPQACSFLSRAASPDVGEDALIVASLRAAGAGELPLLQI